MLYELWATLITNERIRLKTLAEGINWQEANNYCDRLFHNKEHEYVAMWVHDSVCERNT